MTLSAVSSTPSAASGGTGLNSLNPDDFMTLLVAELRLQDPMSPMDTQALVQQLSQMEMVAETRAARESQDFSQALAMMGREVQWQDQTTGAVSSGRVTSVLRRGSEAWVVADEVLLKLNEIVAIS